MQLDSQGPSQLRSLVDGDLSGRRTVGADHNRITGQIAYTPLTCAPSQEHDFAKCEQTWHSLRQSHTACNRATGGTHQRPLFKPRDSFAILEFNANNWRQVRAHVRPR